MAGGDRCSSKTAAELRRGFKTLTVARPNPSAGFYEVRLNRLGQRNALSPAAFAEIQRAMSLLDRLPAARAVMSPSRAPTSARASSSAGREPAHRGRHRGGRPLGRIPNVRGF
ncbi:delta(3,5)-Delta(2,4)-dienoyl-CoA isomerase, mitochondrial [Panicum miliaceum]|uniref:Delta(3,5)-Delta(2,4)-dienoyl-CoA isomerase, mitochondrial n=1 Tax=Panicum miliaceum TaxID=4540 RepID=A0A3L6QJB1_PANMI|nr:delta(3,5)-Delta(2,4)-dienoyl-CoA isomerase, mitochondrial [Panicum miliaceum]